MNIKVVESNLTRAEAKVAMRAGKKLRHRFFLKDEWVTEINGEIVDNDAVVMSSNKFWFYRQDDEWNRSWQVIEITA